MAYNQTLTNFRKIQGDSWRLLKISNRIKHVFKQQLIKVYGQKKNLRNMKTAENYNRKQQSKPILKSGFGCKPCLSGRNNRSCMQVVPATTSH